MLLDDTLSEKLPQNGCFTFIWKIENFSFSPHDENERLQSPTFNVEVLDGTEWYLGIFPGRYPATCHVYRVDNKDEPEFIVTNFKYTFVTAAGTPHVWCQMNGLNFKRGISLGYIEMDRRNKAFKDIFLPKDTLTVMFHMWKSNDKVAVNTQCSARTRISVERRTFNCSINNFLKYKCPTVVPVKVASKHLPSLEMILFCNGGAVFDEKLQIKIRKIDDGENKSMFSTCKISVLDGNGGVGFSAQDEYLFKGSENEWKFPSFIKLNKIASSKDFYLPKDRLTLRFEFAISSGIASQEVEESIYGVPPDRTETQATQENKTLKNDLLSFYDHGILCDVKLRAGDETFPAHWTILCSRSSVFRAMFDSDMKEKTSGVVDIPDLEAEDLHKTLVFLYTDSLDDLQWDSAKSLYAVGDLYEIQELKRKCISFLVTHIAIGNFCECLLFADVYQDKSMMSAIKDFISIHSDEVFESDEWKKLMNLNSKITAEIMHYVLNENYKCRY